MDIEDEQTPLENMGIKIPDEFGGGGSEPLLGFVGGDDQRSQPAKFFGMDLRPRHGEQALGGAALQTNIHRPHARNVERLEVPAEPK